MVLEAQKPRSGHWTWLLGMLLVALLAGCSAPSVAVGQAFTAVLPGTADSPATYLAGVATTTGRRDLLYVTTKDGWSAALDAHTGAAVWQAQNGPGACHVNNGPEPCYTTSAPAVDPSGRYVYGYGLDGYVHKRTADTGTEVTTGGWPELATAKPFDEKGSSHLAIATARSGVSYLYVTNGGYLGDHGDYQGHLTTINLTTGAQTVFNSVCSDQPVHFGPTPAQPDCNQVQSAVWARPGVVYSAATDKVYLTSGNGPYDGARNFGDTVLALHPDGTGAGGGPLDFYTPTDYARLDDADEDLGSTAPAILPTPGGGTPLAVQGGKDGRLRLLDLADLGGKRQHNADRTGGELQNLPVPQGGEVLTQPVSWRAPDGSSWLFVANDNGMSGLELTGSTLQPRWTIPTGGTTPIVVDGSLYYLTAGGARGLDPTSGAQRWTDDTTVDGLHWQSVSAAAGYLFYPDGAGHLHADRLPGH